MTITGEGEFIIDKTFGLCGSEVNEISFTDDGERICAVGAGDRRAGAVLVSTGNKIGDIFGHTDDALTGFLTPRPFHLVSAGQGKEILLHAGVPFKGQGKAINHEHTGFINKMALNADGTKFATAGADKLIGVFDAKTFEK